MLRKSLTAVALACGLIGGAMAQSAPSVPAQPTTKTNWNHPGIWLDPAQLAYVASQLSTEALPSGWPTSAAAEPPYSEATGTMQASIWGLPYNMGGTKAASETCYSNTTGVDAYTYPSKCSDVLNGLAYSDTFHDSNTAVSVEIPLITNPPVVAPAGKAISGGGPTGYLFVQPLTAPISTNPDYGTGIVFGNSMPVNVMAGQVVCGSGTRTYAGSSGAALDETRMGCDQELNAAATAYTQAVLYSLTGNINYAKNAMEVMDYYSGYIQNEGAGALVTTMPPCAVTAVANPTTAYPVPSNLPFPSAWPVMAASAPVAYAPGTGKVPVANCNTPFTGYVYTVYSSTSGEAPGSGVWDYTVADNLQQANKVFSNAPLEATWAAPQWMAAAELIEHFVPAGGSAVSWPGFQTFADWLDIYYFTPYLSQDAYYDDHNGNWILTLLDTRMSYAVLTENAPLYYGTMAEWEEAVPAVFYDSTDDAGWQNLEGAAAPSAPFTYPEGPTDGSAQSVLDGYGWNGQAIWGASQSGIGQEICRDGAHSQYSLSASASTAETAFIQGDPELYTSQAMRMVDAMEFQSSIQLAAIASTGVKNIEQSASASVATSTLGSAYSGDCSGPAARLANAYDPILKGSIEKGHSEFASRLGISMPNTINYLVADIRPVTDTFDWGPLVSPTKEGPNNQIAEDRMGVFWETATNATGESTANPVTPAPAYSGPVWTTLSQNAPTSLAVSGTPSASQVSLNWTNNDSVATSFSVYRNHVLIGTPSSASFIDSGVVGGMTYNYQVYANDATNGQSAESNSLFVTTPVGSMPQLLVQEAPPSYEDVDLPAGSTAITMSTLYTLRVMPSSTFPSANLSSITLSASGGPSGATYTFCAPSISSALCPIQISFGTAIPASLGISVLKVTFPATTAKASYTLTVTAQGDGITSTTTMPLSVNGGGTVVAQPSLSASPSTLPITAGGAASSSSITESNYTGAVTLNDSLAASGCTGVTASMSGTALTVSASSSALSESCTVTVTGTAGSQSASVPITVNVAPGITPVTVTASNGTMVYGGNPPAVTYTFTPASATFTTTPICSTTAALTSAVGGYTTSCSGAAGTNESFTYDNGTMTVTQLAVTISANSASMLQGGTVPALSYAVVPSFTAASNPITFTTNPTCSTTATSASPAGGYPITCSGAVNPNLSITYTPGTLTITPATTNVTVTANNQTMVAGGAVPALIYTLSPAVTPTTNPTCTTAATSSSPAGSYPITCSGAVLSGYTFSYQPGTLTV
ncbi:MAG: MBG domain-containing protein, partial [Terracidiphilus sp.]